MTDFYFIYGVKNLPGNRKIVVTAEHSFEPSHFDPRGHRDRLLNALAHVDVPTGASLRRLGQAASDAGAHEVYTCDPDLLPDPTKAVVGVGAPLPFGSRLLDWGLNGATYTTTRSDGRPGPLDDVWPG
jgi:hypothetical protein